MKLSALRLLVLSFSLFFRGSALTAVDDSATTLPNIPITLAVLTNDFVSTSNAAAILRVTQPATTPSPPTLTFRRDCVY